MNAEERARLIKRYREGHREVEQALSGITPEELDRSAGGGWTPREIVHHLADSEMMSAIRIRRLLTEDEPVIHGY
ncbi:MAG TPA: DinB family protein, partial [Candidatus Eisenbacteria bacterium]|nr:DinB family protein [Candidatus Eisenbacteria bacterium]